MSSHSGAHCAVGRSATKQGSVVRSATTATLGAAASLAVCSQVAFVAPQAAPSVTALRGAAQTTASAPVTNQAMESNLGPVGVAALAATSVAAGAATAASRRTRKVPRSVQRHVTTVEPKVTSNKPSLSEVLPDCPRTIWTADDMDLSALPEVKETTPLIIDAAELGDKLQAGELEYIASQRTEIMDQLQKHGAILFRNFNGMKNAAGFRDFYETLQLNPCLDPIHTSGLREMVDKKDAVYEAVNKPSLAQHFVGLHNESTFVKTAAFGAFVCFKPASEGGGEFIIADGAKIIKDMDPEVLKRIYDQKVRISVSNLDLNFVDSIPVDGVKESVKTGLQDMILKMVAPKFDMDLEMVYGADKSNPWRLQAIEHAQSPINRHPVTGQPVWFCNLHNHSRYLRDRRPCTIPEVGMTDVYYGDLSMIPPEDVRHINETCERNIVEVMMQEGDVVLLDNYRVLHGRRTFKGDRNHAVTWFESCGAESKSQAKEGQPDDFMNNLINKTLV